MGPGVFDMKAGLAVLLAVLAAAGEKVFVPARGVSVLLTPDEELGSVASRGRILEEARRRERVFVLEPSGDGGAAKVASKGGAPPWRASRECRPTRGWSRRRGPRRSWRWRGSPSGLTRSPTGTPGRPSSRPSPPPGARETSFRRERR